VHFCPVFCVMSRTTSATNSAHVSPPGSTSGASTAAFKLSASMFTRTLSATTRGCERSARAVSDEPVNASTSGPRR